MYRKIVLLVVGCSIIWLQAFHLDSRGARFVVKRFAQRVPLEMSSYFAKKKFMLKEEQVVTQPLALQQAAKDALRYIKSHEATHIHTVDPIGFSSILSLNQVKNTLQFIADTIEADKKSGVFRILNQRFINKHFSSVAWRPDNKAAAKHHITLPDAHQIRLTTYAVFSVQGSRTKSTDYPCALYAVADPKLAKRFTKKQIIDGALDDSRYAKKCMPLAWVTEQALEDAMMNGTVLVTFPDDGSRLLNVHCNNCIPYDRKLKNRSEQQRYWFFKDIGSKEHEAARRIERIKNRKDVIFAGDLHNIGLGKLIALRHKNPLTKQPELRLGILADTGSAFYNNLYQLDYFAGLAQGGEELKQIIRGRPSFSQACILYKRG
ncbi:hypothetical protein FJ365_03960 [Candidatus Dependentiae bacterium]|nr:hypothetical protein [Candidatus Dependentiae bacterium]